MEYKRQIVLNTQTLLEKKIESQENNGDENVEIFTYDTQNRLIKAVDKSVSTSSSDSDSSYGAQVETYEFEYNR